MQERYTNRRLYFEEQARTTEKFVIPYIESVKKIHKDMRILEIGCGEAGNLKPFAKRHLQCTGVDLDRTRINLANEFFGEMKNITTPQFIYKDMYDTSNKELGEFDIIMMRDVIEHIPDQEKFLVFIKQFVKKDGIIFFGFPPWQMPFGGHQQIGENKWTRRAVYMHLLPMGMYKYLLKKFGEKKDRIEVMAEIKQTGISIERFQRIIKAAGYKFDKKTYYFINPNYETKFNLKPRKKIPLIGDIPYIRNFITTCMYAIMSKK